MLIYEDARYRVTRRLELARCRLFSWNHFEVDDLFQWIEWVEANIEKLRLREDLGGGLPEPELGEL